MMPDIDDVVDDLIGALDRLDVVFERAQAAIRKALDDARHAAEAVEDLLPETPVVTDEIEE